MSTPQPLSRLQDDDRSAEFAGLVLLWIVPAVGFLLALTGLGS